MKICQLGLSSCNSCLSVYYVCITFVLCLTNPITKLICLTQLMHSLLLLIVGRRDFSSSGYCRYWSFLRYVVHSFSSYSFGDPLFCDCVCLRISYSVQSIILCCYFWRLFTSAAFSCKLIVANVFSLFTFKLCFILQISNSR